MWFHKHGDASMHLRCLQELVQVQVQIHTMCGWHVFAHVSMYKEPARHMCICTYVYTCAYVCMCMHTSKQPGPHYRNHSKTQIIHKNETESNQHYGILLELCRSRIYSTHAYTHGSPYTKKCT